MFKLTTVFSTLALAFTLATGCVAVDDGTDRTDGTDGNDGIELLAAAEATAAELDALCPRACRALTPESGDEPVDLEARLGCIEVCRDGAFTAGELYCLAASPADIGDCFAD